jgi:N-glycosylase/DNA lyase
MSLITVTYEELPEKIFDYYKEVEDESKNWVTWRTLSEQDLWDNLYFCILSSNVTYELAMSAFSHLANEGLLDVHWITTSKHPKEKIIQELSKPQFLPKRKDGSYRKYRFPRCRANNIVVTTNNFNESKTSLKKTLAFHRDETELREHIRNNVYGFGLKQATHYLRNIGYSENLAIIDTHIINFLNTYLFPKHRSKKNFTNNDYLKYENKFRCLCKNLNLKMALFDVAVWKFMRDGTN